MCVAIMSTCSSISREIVQRSLSKRKSKSGEIICVMKSSVSLIVQRGIAADVVKANRWSFIQVYIAQASDVSFVVFKASTIVEGVRQNSFWMIAVRSWEPWLLCSHAILEHNSATVDIVSQCRGTKTSPLLALLPYHQNCPQWSASKCLGLALTRR